MKKENEYSSIIFELHKGVQNARTDGRFSLFSSRKHTYVILTPLNPTFI